MQRRREWRDSRENKSDPCMFITPIFKQTAELSQGLITYLRQMTSHIFGVQKVLEETLERRDVNALWNNVIVKRPHHTATELKMVIGLRNLVKNKPSHKEHDTVTIPVNPGEKSEVRKPRKKSESIIPVFSRLLKELKRTSKWKELKERTLCQQCGKTPKNPYVTDCLHLYCQKCLTKLAHDAANQGFDQTTCSKCGIVYEESVGCAGLKDLETRDLSASVFQKSSTTQPAVKPVKATMEYVDSDKGLLLSTKTEAVKTQLEQWLKEDAKNKIIVFTEWLMMLVISKTQEMR